LFSKGRLPLFLTVIEKIKLIEERKKKSGSKFAKTLAGITSEFATDDKLV
jgi:hypothetical protein